MDEADQRRHQGKTERWDKDHMDGYVEGINICCRFVSPRSKFGQIQIRRASSDWGAERRRSQVSEGVG